MATLALQRRISSSRFSVINSWSIGGTSMSSNVHEAVQKKQAVLSNLRHHRVCRYAYLRDGSTIHCHGPLSRLACFRTRRRPALADAQRAFFNARYQTAADLALALQTSDPRPWRLRVRTSALHFQLRDALGRTPTKGKPSRPASCALSCQRFLNDTKRGQALARSRLQQIPPMTMRCSSWES